MKRIMIPRRLFALLVSFFTAFVLFGATVPAYAAEFPEAEEQTEAEGQFAYAVIRVKADAGTKVTVKKDEQSPESDRMEFECVGDKEKDCFTVRLTEPGDYSYGLTVGTNEYTVRVVGYYEETENGYVFTAKTAIYKPDGSKTDTPTWTPPSDTPFGIADIDGGPIGIVFGAVTVITALGLTLILRKKEEKAR